MKALAAVVIAAYALDFLTFAFIVPMVGGDAEWNEVMRRAYAGFGLTMVAVLKALACIVIVLLIVRIHHRRRRWLAAGVGMTIALVGVAGNLSAITL